jgi:hypothetical protein
VRTRVITGVIGGGLVIAGLIVLGCGGRTPVAIGGDAGLACPGHEVLAYPANGGCDASPMCVTPVACSLLPFEGCTCDGNRQTHYGCKLGFNSEERLTGQLDCYGGSDADVRD